MPLIEPNKAKNTSGMNEIDWHTAVDDNPSLMRPESPNGGRGDHLHQSPHDQRQAADKSG